MLFTLFPLNFIVVFPLDFPTDALQCEDENGPLESFDTVKVRDSVLRLKCGYNKVYPAADLVLHQYGESQPLDNKMKNEATEAKDGSFSLSLDINR